MIEIKFSTPGAAIDWMRAEPERRTVKFSDGIQGNVLRCNKQGLLQVSWDGDDFEELGSYSGFFEHRDFTGHEEPEDTLAAHSAGGVMETYNKWLQRHRTYWAWMSDDQWECALMLSDLYGGFHHMNCRIVREWGDGIAYSHYGQLSTFDFSSLTHLVKMAHDRCIRATIGPSGPGMIRIILHKRHAREGRMDERHPTWEQIKV